MREVFLKVQYVVCWAGCNISDRQRTFDRWDLAQEYYNQQDGQLSLRIEEVTTKIQVKIVWPK